MSCDQEDPLPTVNGAQNERRMSDLPPVVQYIINVENPPGSSLNLQIGDNNNQNFPSTENLACSCCATSSAGSSPVTTIRRSSSRDFLDVSDEHSDQGYSEDIKTQRKLSLGSNSNPITINRVVTRHQYSSEFTSSAPGSGACGSPIPSIVLYQRTSDMESDISSASSNYDTADDDDPDYMSMDACERNEECTERVNHLGDTKCSGENSKKPRAKKLRKIPVHKLEEAQATFGFRSDVNKELKRVRRILKPYKYKDGYYILWPFSEYAIALSVTFLRDIKTFPIYFDKERSSWFIKEDGPISSSLSTLIQIYVQNKIKLPLAKRQGQCSIENKDSNRDTLQRQNVPLSHIGRSSSQLNPASPVTRPVGHRSYSCGEIRIPSLPPKPPGFLALKQPVIQETVDGQFQKTTVTKSVIKCL